MTSKQALGLTMNELAEANAEHVTTISKLEQKLTDMAVQLANAESKCRELAAENAGMKRVPASNSETMLLALDAFATHGCTRPDVGLQQAINVVMQRRQTPATDAFLAEVQAMESKRVYESILDNPAATDMESLVDWLEQNASDSVAFSAQLRKGGKS